MQPLKEEMFAVPRIQFAQLAQKKDRTPTRIPARHAHIPPGCMILLAFLPTAIRTYPQNILLKFD